MQLRCVTVSSLLFIVLLPGRCFAQNSNFPDVPAEHFAYEAIAYLSSKNIVQGYNDGTFRPNALVNRAEALKMILQPGSETTSPFTDVQSGDWFLPYVEEARTRNIIDGPPVSTLFRGSDPVQKVEFLKMLELAFESHPLQSFSEIRLPLAEDVQDVALWYYPYMRYGLTTALIESSTDGLLLPSMMLSRARAAVLLYRMLLTNAGKRTETLLALTEKEVHAVLADLERENFSRAAFASARALLYARGSHIRSPNSPVVVGSLKVTEGLRALVRANEAMTRQDFPEVIRLSKDAWQLADSAKNRTNAVVPLADRVQDMAAQLATIARQ
jgi:hypothetical protein